MFDRNFERKGFFGEKWMPRSSAYMKTKPRGSLLIFDSHIRKSIRPTIRGKGIHFTSPLPYTERHNKGGEVVQSCVAAVFVVRALNPRKELIFKFFG